MALIALPMPSSADTDAALCDIAAAHASDATGVPLSILLALTRTETGRTQSGEMRPWPWTSNITGTGRWYPDRASAHAHLAPVLNTGERRVDIGCFQLNHRWHGGAFQSLDAMLDPNENALYAARFLTQLRAEFGNWEAAVGAYHSRTPHHAERYLARYRLIRAEISTQPPTPQLTAQTQPVTGPRPLTTVARPGILSGHPSPTQGDVSAPLAIFARSARPLWSPAR